MVQKPKIDGGKSSSLQKRQKAARPPVQNGSKASAAPGVKEQQVALEIFRNVFNDVLGSDRFASVLQEVKDALFRRDFDAAFGTEEYLEVYAARWSPTRALCYASVLNSIKPHLQSILTSQGSEPAEAAAGGDADSSAHLRMLAIGGGAAEVVALGACLRHSGGHLRGSLTLVDSAPWGLVVDKLESAVTTPPPLSNYASEAAKAANDALVPKPMFSTSFTRRDALDLDKAGLSQLAGPAPLLVTLFFTLNELFTGGGIGKTTAFLMNITSVIPFGSLLLVVDSPGSYSETVLGSQSKRYPMQWLLDKILLGTEDNPVEGRRWTKVESNDSIWFRLPSSLSYPIPLEDMRYQIHLYRADKADPEDGSEKTPRRSKQG